MSYRTKCEEDLLKAARKYARMKLYGASVADGHVILCCREDVEPQANYLGEKLLVHAEQLLLAMSIDELNGKLEA